MWQQQDGGGAVAGEKISEEKKAEILADIRARGGSCRGIARRHGVSDNSVRRFAQEAGITDAWSRDRTAAATAARVADMADRRTRLAERYLSEAERFLDLLHLPHHVYSFGGKDNDFNDRILDRPPAAEAARLMTSSAVAVDKHLKLIAADSGTPADEAGSVLGQIMAGFRRAYEEGASGDDDTAGPAADEPEADRVDRPQ